MSDRVVNLRDFPTEVAQRGHVRLTTYILPEDVVRIDRRTVWGNPFKIGALGPNLHPLDREQVIGLFRRYAETKIQQEPDWLEPLRGKTVACWCRPPEGFNGRLLCHGQVIVGLLYDVPPETVE